MRARRDKQQELFSFVEIDRLVPADHLLRKIDRHVDFSFIHELVDPVYSDVTGRPAWDPEVILRYVLIGFLYGLSGRRLHEDVGMHAAYRWFLGLTFSDRIPDRSTVIKLCKDKWATVDAFSSIINRVVQQCVFCGLVKAEHLTMDGAQIIADASIKSLETIAVPYTPQEYLGVFFASETEPSSATPASQASGPHREKPSEEAPHSSESEASVHSISPDEQGESAGNPSPEPPDHAVTATRKPKKTHPQDKNFRGERLTNQTHRSRTDPDARLYRKAKGKESRLSYIGTYLADTRSRVILAARAGTPGVDTESSMAVEMLDSLKPSGILDAVKILTADAHYGNTEFLCELDARNITPHIPLLFGKAPESPPTWKNQTRRPERQAAREAKIREVQVRNQARETVQTAGYTVSQKLRKRSEHLFAEAKVCHGMGRARGRGRKSLQYQMNMTATAQNIKRLVSFCSRIDRKKAACRLSNGLLDHGKCYSRAVFQFFVSFFMPNLRRSGLS